MSLIPKTKQMIVGGIVIIAVASMFTGYFDELLKGIGNLIRFIWE